MYIVHVQGAGVPLLAIAALIPSSNSMHLEGSSWGETCRNRYPRRPSVVVARSRCCCCISVYKQPGQREVFALMMRECAMLYIKMCTTQTEGLGFPFNIMFLPSSSSGGRSQILCALYYEKLFIPLRTFIICTRRAPDWCCIRALWVSASGVAVTGGREGRPWIKS